MVENSKIEWCHHTFNPWVGCTKVSAACDHCYAESWAKRSGHPELWAGDRRLTTEANWNKPYRWDRAAEKVGERHRVFCASLADVFDNQVDEAWRGRLWETITDTQNLDWLLLTKRPQNIKKMLPMGFDNVWLGITAENQEEYDRRWPHITETSAAVLFVSYEPALGPLNPQSQYPMPDWIIAGGESGPGYRAPDPQWFRDLLDECTMAGIPFLFKQWGGRTPKAGGRELDGAIHDGYPVPSPNDTENPE